MDQENLSAFHVTKPFCTNSAINTDPVGCAACGSRNYFQISSLPYPLQMYHTYLPRNEKSDKSENGTSIQQPILSNPLLFQPFYPNSLLSTNVFYSSLPFLRPNVFLEESLNMKSENEKLFKYPNPFMNLIYGPHNLPDPTGEHLNKSSNPEIQGNFQVSPFQYAPLCAYTNSFPLTYAPFIVPTIPSYPSWNTSQEQNKAFPSRCPNNSENNTEKPKTCLEETILQRNKKEESKTRSNEEKISSECVKECYWKREKVETNDWKVSRERNGSSSSCASITSLEYCDDNIFLVRKKREEKVTKLCPSLVDNKIQVREDENLSENHQNESQNDTKQALKKTNIYGSFSFKEKKSKDIISTESQSSFGSLHCSAKDVKNKNKSKLILTTPNQEENVNEDEFSVFTTETELTYDSEKCMNEFTKEKIVKISSTNFSSQLTLDDGHNNFAVLKDRNITEQKNVEYQEEISVLSTGDTAAATDLLVNNPDEVIPYKNISTFGDVKENIQELAYNDKNTLQINKAWSSNAEKLCSKTSDALSKSSRISKSGIAKLTSNKFIDKSLKSKEKTKQKVKPSHINNCLTPENNKNSLKLIQPNKKVLVSINNGGTGKPNKPIKIKEKTIVKEENTTKVQQNGHTDKESKIFRK